MAIDLSNRKSTSLPQPPLMTSVIVTSEDLRASVRRLSQDSERLKKAAARIEAQVTKLKEELPPLKSKPPAR